MIKILLLAPSSYPVQHAEAIVNIKLLKCLSNSKKFEIDLISEDINNCTGYPSAPLDSYNINIRTINVIPSSPLRNSMDKILTFLKGIIVSKHIWKINRWGLTAYKIASKLCKQRTYDYILTKDRDSYLVGLLLKKQFKIPVIATWNDPYPEYYYPTPYNQPERIINRIFRKFHEKALRDRIDLHLFPCSRLRNYMVQKLNLDFSKTEVIPHVVLNDEVCELPSINNKAWLSIIAAGNNKSPRNPIPLIQAAKNLCTCKPEININLTFLGPVDDNVKKICSDLTTNLHIDILSSVSYQDSLNIVKDQDIAVVLEADCEEGIFLPTKVTDYMQMRKKIFAISPEVGVLHDLFNEGYIDYFAKVTSVPEIEKQLMMCWVDRERKSNAQIPKSFTEKCVVGTYIQIAELFKHEEEGHNNGN